MEMFIQETDIQAATIPFQSTQEIGSRVPINKIKTVPMWRKSTAMKTTPSSRAWIAVNHISTKAAPTWTSEALKMSYKQIPEKLK